MLFKNLSIFSILGSDPFTTSGLEQGLDKALFTPCGPLDPVRYGWVPPVPGVPEVYRADLFYMTQAVRAIVDAVVEKLGVPA